MTNRNTRHAEKEYLARTGSSVWEQHKPFSPPGTDTLSESAHMLHDFAVALLALQPGPDELILDLGAGGCWCSDLLNRLNRSTVAIDISLDMLMAGRARPGPPLWAVASDMEALPFKDESFQKAICLSAIHHVPDISRAVGEVARVLSVDGVAFFSEPGEGHAEAPVSRTAVRSYGVLEQDIVVATFMRQCLRAGFTEVVVQPLLLAVPGVALSVDQWEDWTRLAASTRPHRALNKIIFGFLELLGFGKRGALFQEALAISMVRTLRQVVTNHPVVVARKAPAPISERPLWRAMLTVDVSNEVPHGRTLSATVRATNLGTNTWRPTSTKSIGHVTLGIQLLDEHQRVTVRDYQRVLLPHPVGPSESITIHVNCPVPTGAAGYYVKFDMVAEGVTWFELAGSVPVLVHVGGP